MRLRPYELVDIPSGRVLATNDWWHELVGGPTRDIIEREGRERSQTLILRGGYVDEDDGTPLEPDEEPATGEKLARAALSEPYSLEHEPPIELDPHQFTSAEFEALPQSKFEYGDGAIFDNFDNGQTRATVMRALLANMGSGPS